MSRDIQFFNNKVSKRECIELIQGFSGNSNSNLPLTNVAITNTGSDYQIGTSDNISLISLTGSGTGATADITVSEGKVITNKVITNNGAGYNAGVYPNIALDGGTGGGARADLTIIQGGNIESVNIINRGSLYTTGTYSNVPATGGSGTGAEFLVTVSSGKIIESIFLNNGGTGYIDGIYTGVRASGSLAGNSALFTVTVDGGEITAVVIEVGGEDYEVGDILYLDNADMGGSGVGGFIEVLTTSAVGAVYSVEITNAGENYVDGDLLSFDAADIGGTGSGVQVSVTEANAIGNVSELNEFIGGEGYEISDLLTVSDPIIGAGSNFEIAVTGVTAGGVITNVNIVTSGSGYKIGDILRPNIDHTPDIDPELVVDSVLTVTELSSGDGNVIAAGSATGLGKIPVSADFTGKNIKYSDVILTLDPETGLWLIVGGLQSIFQNPPQGQSFDTYDVGNVIGGKIGESTQSTSASPVRLFTLPLVGNKVINLSGSVNAVRVGGDSGLNGDSCVFKYALGGKVVNDVVTIGTLDLITLYEDHPTWTITASVDGGSSIAIDAFGEDDMIIDWTHLVDYNNSNVD